MTGLGKLEDRLFKAPYLCGGALVLIAVSALDLAWGYASRQWFVDKGGGFRLLDFACLWSGGDLALRKSAIDAYDYLSMSAAQRDLLGIIVPDDRYFRWVYPPILFFYVMPFALLPYAPAFFAWAAATASLYASAIHRILGPRLAILVAWHRASSPRIFCWVRLASSRPASWDLRSS